MAIINGLLMSLWTFLFVFAVIDVLRTTYTTYRIISNKEGKVFSTDLERIGFTVELAYIITCLVSLF